MAEQVPTFETFVTKVAPASEAGWFSFTLQNSYVDAATGESHHTALVPGRLVELLEPEGQLYMLEEEAFHFEFESGNRVRNLWVRPPLLVGGWRDSYLGKFYR